MARRDWGMTVLMGVSYLMVGFFSAVAGVGLLYSYLEGKGVHLSLPTPSLAVLFSQAASAQEK